MKVVVLHRALGNPNADWYPWLKGKLEDEDIEVDIPELGEAPEYKSWVDKAGKALAGAGRDTFVVGHSLGNTAAFRVLESFPEGESIGGMIIAANVYEMPKEVPDDFRPVAKFYEKPID